MFSGESAKGLKINEWIIDWNTYCETNPPPQSIRKRIIDPLVDGDPLFCTVLSIELISKKEYMKMFEEIFSTKIDMKTSSPNMASSKRTLLCEIIFHLTKCPSPECKTLISLLCPIIIWTEWCLSNFLHKFVFTSKNISEDEEVLIDLLEEDLSSLEVVILAIWQLDFKLSPLPLTCRFVDLRRKTTIYKDRSPSGLGPYPNPQLFSPEILKNESPSIDLTIRPFLNNSSSTIIFCPPMISSIDGAYRQPLKIPKVIDKLDSSTRVLVTLRLLKLSIDHLPSFSDENLITFTFVILRLLNFSFTKFDSSPFSKLSEDGDDDTKLFEKLSLFGMSERFFTDNEYQYTFSEDMLLLLIDLLLPLYYKFPKLEIFLRNEFITYSEKRLFVRPILSLSE